MTLDLLELKKLDWFPVYVHRAKGSETWQLPDRLWCWFWKLLINAADSERPGYLPNDVDELWGKAGSDSKAYFLRRREFEINQKLVTFARGGMSLVDRYFCATADGLWIYNKRLLQVLVEQSAKSTKPPGYSQGDDLMIPLSLSFSLIDSEQIKQTTEELFSFYREQVRKDARYKLTMQRRKKCERRLSELLKDGGTLEAAVATVKEAIGNLAGNEWNMTNGYTDWIDHLFKSQEIFQKRLTVKPSNGAAVDKRPRTPDPTTDPTFGRDSDKQLSANVAWLQQKKAAGKVLSRFEQKFLDQFEVKESESGQVRI